MEITELGIKFPNHILGVGIPFVFFLDFWVTRWVFDMLH